MATDTENNIHNHRPDKGKGVGLRGRMLLSFGLLFVLLIAAMETIEFYGIPFTDFKGEPTEYRSEAFRYLNLVADLKKDRLVQWLSERHDDAHVLAASHTTRISVEQLYDTIEMLSRKYHGDKLTAALIDDSTYILLRQSMRTVQATENIYRNIFIANSLDGTVMVSTDEKQVGWDVSTEKFFTDPQQMLYSYMTDITTSQDGRAVFYIGQAIYSVGENNQKHKHQQIIGILVLEVDADHVITPIVQARRGMGQTGEVLLVNKDSRIITTLRHPLADGSIAEPLKYEIMTKPAKLAASGQEGIIESIDYREVPVFAAFRYIRISPDVGWGMVIKRDRSEVMAAYYKSARSVAVVIAVGTVVFLILVVVVSTSLSRPLRSLSETAQRVADGDLEARFHDTGPPEIIQMGQVFNWMVERIQGWHSEMKEQVAARTAGLANVIQRLNEEIEQRKNAEQMLVGHAQQMENALEKLKVSEEKFRSVTETAKAAVISADSKGNVVLWNKSAERIFGYACEEIIGKSLTRIMPLRYHHIHQKGMERIVNTGKSRITNRVIELYGLRRDQTEFPIELSLASWTTADGMFSTAIINDVTERKQAESDLLESQSKLKQSQEIAHMGSWDWDIKTGQQAWSDEHFRVFGYEPGEIEPTYNHFIKAIHPEDRKKVLNTVEDALSEKKVYDIEFRIVRSSGQIRWIYTNGQVYRDQDDAPERMAGTVLDITERKETEAELKRIEWLLGKDKDPNIPPEERIYSEQAYGDLTDLNRSGILKNMVDKKVLVDIVRGYLDLLDTSAAVYEKKGDYALGIFSSGWCQFLDNASRKLCCTKNNKEALESGKWHCHESCWNKASKIAIETGQPVDIECKGGLNLYAVPIFTGKEIVGSINFGYGDPPKDLTKLQEISKEYGVSVDELINKSNSYQTRPSFIVEIAKNRLRTSAKIIGGIVERKQGEEALLESHEKLKTSIDNMPNAYILCDTQTIVLEWNRAAEKIFGYSKEEVLGKNLIDLVVPEKVRHLVGEAVKKLKAGEVADHSEKDNNIRKDGQLISCQWCNTPLEDKTGEVFGILFMAQDITERMQAEEELFQYACIASSSKDMMAILDNDFVYLAANEAYLAAFGMAKDKLVGHSVSQVFGQEFFETTIKPHAEHCLQGNEVSYENWFDFPVHGSRFMLVGYYPYTGPDGDISGFVVTGRDITERKQAEDQLRERTRVNKILLDNFPCVAMLLRPQTREIVAANAAAVAVGAVPGKTCFETFGKSDKSCPWCLAPEVWATGQKRHEEFEGLGIFWDAYWVPIADDLYMHYAFDITERKKSAKSLEQSEERFRRAVVDSPFPIMIHADDGEVLQISRIWTDLTGYRHEEIPTLSEWTARAYGEKMDVVKSRIDKIFDCETRVAEGEYVISTKSGDTLVWDFSSAPLGKLPDGRRLVISMAMDVTHRKQAEKSIQEINQQLQTSIEQMPTAYILWDADFNILEWNHGAENIFGYTKEEIIGKPGADYIVPKEIRHLVSGALETLAEGEPINYSQRDNNITKDGRLISCQWHNKPLKDQDGRVFATLSIAEDITEKLAAEDKARLHQEELAHVSRVATAGEMASGIAHEINQPLCAITNFADGCLRMTRSGKTDPVILDNALEHIAAQAQRAGKVIHHLKNLVKKQPATFAKVGVDSIIDGALVLVENDARKKGVKIKLKLAEKLPKVYADSILVQQVILNLINNSFDAMADVKASKRKLIITAKKTKNNQVEIAVSDTGKGISKENIEKMFDSFYTTKPDGLGVGLSISKSIIETHSGGIWATSNPDSGATFHFTLATRSKKR